jgi:hypothetical protein
MEDAIGGLEEDAGTDQPPCGEGFARFAGRHDLTGWEGRFSPYDEDVYQAVVGQIRMDDVVFDIGAGDLRLALRMSDRARHVYAIEVNPLVLAQALGDVGLDLPRNLNVICGNAIDFPVPARTTVAVLLMRHCHHFVDYVARLEAAGCQRLITNARWRTDVEVIDLTTPGGAFDTVIEGWYACRCGATGYVGMGDSASKGPMEVAQCPACVPDSTI